MKNADQAHFKNTDTKILNIRVIHGIQQYLQENRFLKRIAEFMNTRMVQY